MSPWLYEKIREVDQNRQPYFSSQSTANWFAALRFEIELKHGMDPRDQFTSCRNFYKAALKRSKTDPVLGNIVEPLFFSILNCMSLERLAVTQNNIPWLRPTSIVNWYYAIYFSVRSIFAALAANVADDHMKSANCFVSTIKQQLPYPLNMVATHERGEDYCIELDGVKSPPVCDLNRTFVGERNVSLGMLAQYLHGTTKWYAERTKKKILLERKDIPNFRTKSARELRDSRLLSEIGFLHCAYRQRVKANYRDAIYLSYGKDVDIELDQFLSNLAASARFVSIVAMAFIERRIGNQVLQELFTDLDDNLKSMDIATPLEKFWTTLL